MLHRTTRSPLVRLPDDILINIMGHADDVSLLCLRRARHTILQMFSTGIQFPRFHDQRVSLNFPRLFDFTRSLEKIPETAKPGLQAPLRKDMHRELCRSIEMHAKRKKLKQELLYYSRCKTKHSVGLFSYDQRRGASNTGRICIGREGHVRMCAHMTLSWVDVEQFLYSSSQTARFSCLYASHQSIFGQGSCRDHDHILSVKLNRSPISVPHPHCCENQASTGGVRPWLCVKWSTHITFPDLGTSLALDYDEVLNKIERARNVAGSHIFQYPRRKFLVELQFFDPNSCRCIRLPDLTETLFAVVDKFYVPYRKGHGHLKTR